MSAEDAGGSVFSPDPYGRNDDLAEQEAVKIVSGADLEVDGHRQEHERHQKFRNHVNAAMLGLFWLMVGLVAVGSTVFVWHLVTPTSWQWLEGGALEKLQTLLAAALLSSALTGYVNKRIAS